MSTNKRQAAVVVATAALMVCMMSGCVNSWTIIGSYKIGGDALAGIETFYPDGTLTWSQPSADKSGTGTWTLVGNNLTIVYSSGSVHEGRIDGTPFSFSVYGELCVIDAYGACSDTSYGTTQFNRRFLGLLDAVAAVFFDVSSATKLKTTDAGCPAARVMDSSDAVMLP